MAYTYKYPRLALTVDCVIFLQDRNGLKVLLIQRKYPPFQNQWAFPGGFVDIDEELEDAAKRELKEETGLHVNELTQLGAFGEIGRDPRGRTVSVVYLGFAKNGHHEVRGGDDAASARWFSPDEIPALAFDHKKILNFALQKTAY